MTDGQPRATEFRRGLAFMICPPHEFPRLLQLVRAAEPGVPFDLVCYYDPGPLPDGTQRIRQPGTAFAAAQLWLRMLFRPARVVFVACLAPDHVKTRPLFLQFVASLRASSHAIVDADGRRIPLDRGSRGELAVLLLTAIVLTIARGVTWLGLKAAPHHQAAARRGDRLALVVPIMPDLSHTFVYREVLALRAHAPGAVVFVLEPGSQTVVHSEAADLGRAAMVVPKMSALRYLTMYLWLWLRHPRRMAGLIRFFTPHTELFGPGAPPHDPYVFLRIEHLHHTNHLIAGLMFAYEVRRLGIGYVHTWGSTFPAVRTLVAHRLWGVPFSLSTYVDYDYVTPFHLLREKFSAARFIVVCTGYCATHIPETFPDLEKRPVVIRHGLSSGYASGKTLRARDGNSRLVYVGRFVPKKGLDTLVAAAGLLKAEGVAFTCHLYGGGELEPQLRRQVQELGLQNVVKFETPVPNEAFYSVMNRDDIFVCPSRYMSDGERDGIPVSLMEAMAGGITVVSTPVSGIPELIDDGRNGYLVAPEDPAALAQLLRRLILDPAARARVSEAARETIAADFSVEYAGRRLHELISRETRSSSGAPGHTPEWRPAAS